jgi:DNA-directed RNA polymerase subunit beta
MTSSCSSTSRAASGRRAARGFQIGFPDFDFSNAALLEFVKYEFEPPKYDVDECRQRGMTFAAPLKVTLRLIVFDVDPDTAARSVKDIKEQDVYMGDMPLMTMNGTFIVNGTGGSSFRKCTVRRGCFSITTKAKSFFRQASVRGPDHSLSRAPGSISNSTPRTSSMPASTAGKFRRRRSFTPSGWMARRSLSIFYKTITFAADRTGGVRRSSPIA